MEADKWNEGVKEMLLEIGIWYHKSKLDDWSWEIEQKD
jgi:hypothetical protein